MSTDLSRVGGSTNAAATSMSSTTTTTTTSSNVSQIHAGASEARRQQVLRAQGGASPNSAMASAAVGPGEMWEYLTNIKDTTARWGIWLDGVYEYQKAHGGIGVEPLLQYASAIHALPQEAGQEHQTAAADEIVSLMARLEDGGRFNDLDAKIGRVLRGIEMSETARIIAERLLTDIETDNASARFAGKQHFAIWAIKEVDADGRIFGSDASRRADITRLELSYQPVDMRAQTWTDSLNHFAVLGTPAKEIVRPFARSIELIAPGKEHNDAISRLVRMALTEASGGKDPASLSAIIHDSLAGVRDETVRLCLAKQFFAEADGTLKKKVLDVLSREYDVFSPTAAFALRGYLASNLP